jgi:hypothetical protein
MELVTSERSQTAWLVDENGVFWMENSIELRRHLFCVHYPGDLATDIIRNLGYIGVRRSTNGVTFRLHTTNMSDVAVAALLYWIVDTEIETAVFNCVDHKHPLETVLGTTRIIDRLCELSSRASLNRRVFASHVDIGKIHASSELKQLSAFWCERQGVCTHDQIEDIASRTTSGRFIRIGLSPGHHFVAQSVGPGLQIPDPGYAESLLGRPIGERGDLIYFNWVISNYENTWRSGRPDLADIRATVQWPTIGTVHNHYERLLLPCINSNGERYLFSAAGRPVHERLRMSQVG